MFEVDIHCLNHRTCFATMTLIWSQDVLDDCF
jgi:hypothetical protein